jgi:uncharacterized membrane protein YfcA
MPAWTPKNILLLVLALVSIGYLIVFIRGIARARAQGKPANPGPLALGTGFFTNFWDTLGIGSFATTTAIFRAFKMVPDEHIPGTLNVGHIVPTVVQAFIFTKLVDVETRTLFAMIAAAVAGAWLGAGVVARWPRRWVQIGMGSVLLGAAAIITYQVVDQAVGFGVGGTALALSGPRLAIGVVGNFVLGALMTLGIGLYAPCMILVSLLGMNPTAAFPIMMSSCAFLMPIASVRFIRAGSYHPGASLGLMLGGIPAVLLAVWLIRNLDLMYIRVLVICVVLYTAASLLLTARRERRLRVGVKGGTPQQATS